MFFAGPTPTPRGVLVPIKNLNAPRQKAGVLPIPMSSYSMVSHLYRIDAKPVSKLAL